MIDSVVPDKPASDYTPEERRTLIREARMYMFEVQKRMERLAELEDLLAKADELHEEIMTGVQSDEPSEPT